MSEIAVVLPVYNGMKFLNENIKSVLNQHYKDFSFLICDDCSSDGSWDYLKSLSWTYEVALALWVAAVYQWLKSLLLARRTALAAPNRTRWIAR